MVLKLLRPAAGFSIVEVLIAVVLLAMVFVGAISIYVSGLKFLGGLTATSSQLEPVINVDEMSKRIQLANDGAVELSGAQLLLRGDYDWSSGGWNSRGTPGDFTDDSCTRYRFLGTELHLRSEAAAGGVCSSFAVTGSDTLLISNLRSGSSSFTAVNPSGQGNPTVYAIDVVQLFPGGGTSEIKTAAALGAKTKR